jgi:hypothetical protein
VRPALAWHLRLAGSRSFARPFFPPTVSTQKTRDLSARLKYSHLAVNTCHMAEKPEPPKPTSWSIYRIAAKVVRLGAVEPPDEATAIASAAVEFNVPVNGLMPVRRCPAAKAKSPVVTSSANGRIAWPPGRKGAGHHEQRGDILRGRRPICAAAHVFPAPR